MSSYLFISSNLFKSLAVFLFYVIMVSLFTCAHGYVCAGLVDEQQKVRTITALALAALAEAATPYGIESFDSVLKPLWKGIRQHRGKVCTDIASMSFQGGGEVLIIQRQ